MIGAGKAEHAMVVASEIENNSGDNGHPLYGLSETGSAVILSRAGDKGFGRFVFHHYPEYGDALTTYTRHARRTNLAGDRPRPGPGRPLPGLHPRRGRRAAEARGA